MIEDEIKDTARRLRSGEVIACPTDTIWGLSCDATNVEAVRRIYAIKRRSDSKSLILLVDSVDTLWRYVDNVPEVAEQLIEATVHPLTVIYDHARNLPQEVVANDGSIAIRVTSDEFTRGLCRRLGRPIVSTSANISGQPAPQTFAEISPEILATVDYVVEARRDAAPGRPSSIIKVGDDATFKIIRP